MNLFALTVARRNSDKVVFLCSAFHLKTFSFFEKKVVRETCVFFLRTAIPRVDVGGKEIVQHEGNLAYICISGDGLSVAAVANEEYPQRLAFELLSKTRKAFSEAVAKDTWRSTQRENTVPFKAELQALLDTYAEPQNFDLLVQSQQQVDTVQEQMRENVKLMLQTGENLEALVGKSHDLSTSSKQLFKTSRSVKKHHACCRQQ